MNNKNAYTYHPIDERRAFLRFGKVDLVDMLDIGAGRGELTMLAASELGCTVTCIDPDPAKLARAREAMSSSRMTGNVTFEQGDATRMRFADGEFTCVACYSVLHHVPEGARERMVAEVARVAGEKALFAEINDAGAKYFDEVLHPGEHHGENKIDKAWLLKQLEGKGTIISEDRPYTYFIMLVKPRLEDKVKDKDGRHETDLDNFAEDLQKELVAEELQEYNNRIVSLFHDPPNHGKLEGAGVVEHSYLGPCGDRMTFFLRIEHGIITKANFITTGCGASVATGAQTTLLAEGISIEQAATIDAATIDRALGGLPRDHAHCAELAARTLHQALQKALNTHPLEK